MAETEYVFRNTQHRPDRSGVVRPFLTRTFNGRPVAVSAVGDEVEALALLGEPVPAPDGLETAPLRAKDVQGLLADMVREQRITNRMLELIAERLRPKIERPTPKPLMRWQRVKNWCRRLLGR